MAFKQRAHREKIPWRFLADEEVRMIDTEPDLVTLLTDIPVA